MRFPPAPKAVLRHAVVWDVKRHQGKRRILQSDHPPLAMMLPRKPVCRKDEEGKGAGGGVEIRLDIELEKGGDGSHKVQVNFGFYNNHGVS